MAGQRFMAGKQCSILQITLSGLLLCLQISLVQAEQPAQEPEPPARVTVREVLSEELHNTQVDITGVVLRQVGPNTVLIHDGTAAVEVDIPQEQIPAGGLKSNTRIRIKGEVTHDESDNHEVEANQIFWTF